MALKKIYNDVESLVEEVIIGQRLMFPGGTSETLPDNIRISVRKPEFKKPKGLVKIAGGGGSGHEGPGGRGFEPGPGGGDVSIRGDIFVAPSAAQIFKGLCAIDDGSPIYCGVANHTGDVMNFRLAVEMAKARGMDVTMHTNGYTDVGSAPKERAAERRGGGGFAYAGLMAECGEPVEEIIRMSIKGAMLTRSFGVGIRSAIHPVTGLPIMEMPDDMIEMGIGVHGENSGKRIPLPRSKELARIVCDILLDDMPVERGEEISLGLRGLGGLAWTEIYILYKDIHEYLVGEKGIKILRVNTGNSGTQELGGFILSITRQDDEVKKWANAKIPEGRYPSV